MDRTVFLFVICGSSVLCMPSSHHSTFSHQHNRHRDPPAPSQRSHHHRMHRPPPQSHTHNGPNNSIERPPMTSNNSTTPTEKPTATFSDEHNFRCAVCHMFVKEVRLEFSKLKLNDTPHHPFDMHPNIGRYTWYSGKTLDIDKQSGEAKGIVDADKYGTADNPALFTTAFGDPTYQLTTMNFIIPARVCNRFDQKLTGRCTTFVQLNLLPELLGGDHISGGPSFSPLKNTLCEEKCQTGAFEDSALALKNEREGWEELDTFARHHEEHLLGLSSGDTLQG